MGLKVQVPEVLAEDTSPVGLCGWVYPCPGALQMASCPTGECELESQGFWDTALYLGTF